MLQESQDFRDPKEIREHREKMDCLEDQDLMEEKENRGFLALAEYQEGRVSKEIEALLAPPELMADLDQLACQDRRGIKDFRDWLVQKVTLVRKA